MKILFMMPRWEDASTGWMGRMMECISDDLVVVVVNDSRGNHLWKKKVPVVSLYPPVRELRYASRLFGFLGLSLTTTAPKAEHILQKAIRQFQVTHILCQYGTYATKFMKVWRGTDLPLSIHFHGYDATFNLCASDQPEKRVFADEYLRKLKELDDRATFIVNSDYTRSLLLNVGISPNCMRKKSFGIPLAEINKIHQKIRQIQILHLGRLVDFKSPDRSIRAFEIAKSKGLDGDLILAGDGPLRVTCELLRLRSPYRDSIHILGAVNDQEAKRLYSDSDIFTAHNMTGEISRQTECFGVSVVEAMASGLPVVGTRNGGVVETVVDGETGILVSPGDVEAQAEAFLQLANDTDLRQRMGNAGRARVSALFSPQQEADQLRKIMKLPHLAT